MRAQIVLATCLTLASALPLAAPVRAQAPRAPAAAQSATPQKLGTFEDWTAARHQEDGRTVCYAFTRASKSAPPVPNRTEVVLTVTQRPNGRDTVAITAGFDYPANADVTVNIDLAAQAFYTSKRFAFAKDGPATVAAMQRGRSAIARGPGPRNIPVEDTFSLRGFSPAYAAIVKACPPTR